MKKLIADLWQYWPERLVKDVPHSIVYYLHLAKAWKQSAKRWRRNYSLAAQGSDFWHKVVIKSQDQRNAAQARAKAWKQSAKAWRERAHYARAAGKLRARRTKQAVAERDAALARVKELEVMDLVHVRELERACAERDEARRVAKVLGRYIEFGHYDRQTEQAIAAARAYQEPDK